MVIEGEDLERMVYLGDDIRGGQMYTGPGGGTLGLIKSAAFLLPADYTDTDK